MNENMEDMKALLTTEEFCHYLGIGKTKGREILTKTDNPFTVRIGRRVYANKWLLDKWLLSISGNKVKRRQIDLRTIISN